ncbi:MAG: hypothetical protein H6R25_3366 [Proteobacteria bacterium]|nr:hypothetical protein [Pseudomonadota bacterium]
MDNITRFNDYINYYKGLINPGYAILITGEWGAGKTHHIKKILNEEEMYYVSLFDVTSVENIYASVFYKMSPVKAFAKKVTGGIGETNVEADVFTFGLGGIISKIAEVAIKEDVKTDRVIVFDDIERSSVSINKILGVINKYVEHHGCKVIAIAHDEKIKGSFDDAKEKVIGQTLRIEPDLPSIFLYILQNEIKKEIPKKIKDSILNTFIASQCKSIRILKHTIKDAVRLLDCIDKSHRNNEKAMEDIFSFFTAITINYRYGKIKDDDLQFRSEKAIKYYVSKKNEDKTALVEINEQYRKQGINLDLTLNTLSDDTLQNCLSKGYYDETKIKNDIATNRYLNTGLVESWLTLMHFDELTADQVINTIATIDNELANFTITDTGKIFHIFNLKMLMTTIGAHKLSYKDVLNFFVKYLEELLKRNLLEHYEPNERFTDYPDSSHGYAYWVRDEYRKPSNYMFQLINKYKIKALHKNYPSYIKEIFDSLNEEPDKFKKIVSYGYGWNGKFASLDILKHIKPYIFVEKWLDSPVNYWQPIKQGLEERYNSGALHSQLKEERIWITRVNYLLMHRAKKATGFDRLRLERLTCRTI